MFSNPLRYGAAALIAATLLAGCGGGSSKGSAAKPSVSPTSSTAAAGQATASNQAGAGLAAIASQGAAVIGGAAGELDISKQCAAIPVADVQALLKASPGPTRRLPLICAWQNTDLQVSLSPNDTDKHNYTDLVSSEGHAIAGLGDVAQWSQPVPGATVPDVNAHKGTLTCYVQSAGDISTTTLPYTGSEPFFKITEADALAYATKEAKLCADIFAAS